MINIVGIGKLGCELATDFEKLKNYDVYKLDHGLEKTKRTRGIKKEKTPEKYEQNCPGLSYFFKGMSGKSLVLVSGGELISAITLRVLEQMPSTKTTVLYVQPDLRTLNEQSRLTERVIFNVLQEYARSGVIAGVILTNAKDIETAIGNVPIIGYEETFRGYIVNSLNLIYYFEHAKPVLSSDSEKIDHSRIMTLGMVDFTTGQEKTFFPLDNTKERMYYYGINDTELRNDNNLISKIREQIDSKRDAEQRTSYRVYSTSYEEPHVFCIQSSAMIQKTT